MLWFTCRRCQPKGFGCGTWWTPAAGATDVAGCWARVRRQRRPRPPSPRTTQSSRTLTLASWKQYPYPNLTNKQTYLYPWPRFPFYPFLIYASDLPTRLNVSHDRFRKFLTGSMKTSHGAHIKLYCLVTDWEIIWLHRKLMQIFVADNFLLIIKIFHWRPVSRLIFFALTRSLMALSHVIGIYWKHCFKLP